MATSLYKIAEQCKSLIGKGNYQEYITAVSQAFATVVKQEFFNGKQDGISEINGAFIFSFSGVAVSLDATRNKYYATLPASYINLPHDYGVVSISTIEGEESPFVKIAAGQMGLFVGIDAEGFQGQQPYYIEGDPNQGARIWLPKLKASDDVDELLVKLSLSLDGVDVDTSLALSPELQQQVVMMVVNQYAPQPAQETRN